VKYDAGWGAGLQAIPLSGSELEGGRDWDDGVRTLKGH